MSDWWNAFVAWLRSLNTSGSGGSGGGSSVPELAITYGPLALVLILCIIAIGLERRRLKNKKV